MLMIIHREKFIVLNEKSPKGSERKESVSLKFKESGKE